ncbi:MAG: tRNA pseudouridine(38-40) synthase TruA [Anaerolineaceae bacterium]
MARYQLRLAYDGTEFFGFQRQGNTRTVQSVFEAVLRELGWQEEAILFAGRTDTGVHASGQVVVFVLDWQHDDEALLKALNAKLPPDAAVDNLARVETEFHPRYDALSRSYIYNIYERSERDPLKDRLAWRLWPALEIERLNQAASMLVGKHDFSAFGRAMKPGASTIREVILSQWSKPNGQLQYKIEGNAFLYHMVRRIVYLQVQFAKNKLSEEELLNGVYHCQTMRSGLAPAKGLILSEVKYPKVKQVEIENSDILDNMA